MNNHTSLTPSILDRLIDVSYGRQSTDSEYRERDLIASIERDLESLLNSRQTRVGLDSFPELQHSVIGFGLPDAQVFDLETSQARYRLAQTIESVIEAFEPRVSSVDVEILDENIRLHSLKMKIRARLHLDSSPEIAFETTLKLATGQYEIKPSKTSAIS